MKLIFSFVALAVGLMAQNVIYLRVPGTGFCEPTSVTGAGVTVRVTVATLNDCKKGNGSTLANGDKISVRGVRGNTAANSRPSTTVSQSEQCRTVQNLSGTSFDLYDCPGTVPVIGNAAWVGGVLNLDNAIDVGARIGAVDIRTPHLVDGVVLDGAAGSYTSSLVNAPRNSASNPARVALNAQADAYIALPQTWGRAAHRGSSQWQLPAITALWWRINGGGVNAYRSALVFDLQQVSQTGTVACSIGPNGNCGPPNYEEDYRRQAIDDLAVVYTTMRNELSAPERQAIADYVLNDLPAPGGHDWVGSSHPVLAWKINRNGSGAADVTHGTASWASGSSTVTGVGTNWASAAAQADGHSELVSVGNLLYVPHPLMDQNSKPCKVSAVISNTQVTCENPAVQTFSGTSWGLTDTPISNNMGLAYALSAYPFQWREPSPQRVSANVLNYHVPFNNLTLVGLLGQFSLGLALCRDDNRGCDWAAEAWDAYHDESLRHQLTIETQTGYNASSVSYNAWRMATAHGRMLLSYRNGAAPIIDPCPLLGEFCSNGARMAVHLSNSDDQFFTMSEPYGTAFTWTTFFSRIGAYASALAGSANLDVQRYYNALVNQHTFTSGALGVIALEHYLGYDPSATKLLAPTTSSGKTESFRSVCSGIWGAAKCRDTVGFYGVTSRKNWTGGVSAIFSAASGGPIDHSDTREPGRVQIYTPGKTLLGGGGDALGSYAVALEQLGTVFVGSTSNNPNYPGYVGVHKALMPWKYGSATATFARADLSYYYKPGAQVTYAGRSVFHDKVGDYFATFDSVQTASAQPIWGWWHFPLNGCGTQTSTACIALNRAAKTVDVNHTSVGMGARFLPVGPTSAVLLTNDSGSDTSHVYSPNNAGYSARVKVCPDASGSCGSVTSAEWFSVFKVTTGGAVSMPALTDVSGGGIRGVQVAEATPLVFATVPQGATVTSGSFVTTHAGTGRYLVGGLAAGSVNVTRNGSPVAGSPITVTAGEHAIEFTSLAGTIAISAAGGALTILTTSPLPAGTVGSAYSRTLAASGGTPAYTWTVSAGALPPGLTLSGAGLLSGTPSSTGVFSFTARVQDAAAAAVTLPLSLTINTVLGPATTRDIVFRFRPPSGRVVTALRLESGATSGLLATPQTVACTAGCSLTITADTGSSLYFRLRWYNGASPAGAASRIRLITVP